MRPFHGQIPFWERDRERGGERERERESCMRLFIARCCPSLPPSLSSLVGVICRLRPSEGSKTSRHTSHSFKSWIYCCGNRAVCCLLFETRYKPSVFNQCRQSYRLFTQFHTTLIHKYRDKYSVHKNSISHIHRDIAWAVWTRETNFSEDVFSVSALLIKTPVDISAGSNNASLAYLILATPLAKTHMWICATVGKYQSKVSQ